MEYRIEYQYMPANASRPQDWTLMDIIEAGDKSGQVVLPSVGDFVSIDSEVRGRVSSRYFSYARMGTNGWMCLVNIVVTDAPDQDWGKLIKE